MATRKRVGWGKGHVRQDRSGNWSILWRTGDGRRLSRGGFLTEPEAREALTIVLGQRALTRIASMAGVAAGAPVPSGLGWAGARWERMTSREKQAVIFVKFNGRCAYCDGEVVIPTRADGRKVPNRAVMDHRVPVASGGSHGMENIVLACHACNAKKSDRDIDVGA